MSLIVTTSCLRLHPRLLQTLSNHRSYPEHVSGEVVVQRANRQAACRLIVRHLVMLFAASTLTSIAAADHCQLPSKRPEVCFGRSPAHQGSLRHPHLIQLTHHASCSSRSHRIMTCLAHQLPLLFSACDHHEHCSAEVSSCNSISSVAAQYRIEFHLLVSRRPKKISRRRCL